VERYSFVSVSEPESQSFDTIEASKRNEAVFSMTAHEIELSRTGETKGGRKKVGRSYFHKLCKWRRKVGEIQDSYVGPEPRRFRDANFTQCQRALEKLRKMFKKSREKLR
jgi:hypothetical protein